MALEKLIDKQAFLDKLEQSKVQFDYSHNCPNYRQLDFEYGTLCSALNKPMTEAQKTHLIEISYQYAYLLHNIYQNYLNVPREATRLLGDMHLFHYMLFQETTPAFLPNQSPKERYLSFTIRRLTSEGHAPRVFLARFRAFVMSFSSVIKHFPDFLIPMLLINPYLGLVFTHFAWIFFVPRLFNNLFFSAKHIIPNPWMTMEEKSQRFSTRVQTQWSRRGYEIANDAAWFAAGLVIAFACFGSVAMCGIYITAALRFYDIILALIESFYEENVFSHLQKNGLSLADNDELKQLFRSQLEPMVTYENKGLNLKIANSIALFLSSVLTFSCVAFSPYVAIFGCGLAVGASIAQYIAKSWVQARKPINPLGELKRNSRLSFFTSDADGASKCDDMHEQVIIQKKME